MEIARTAIISDCGCYRYLLTRTWDALSPSVLFVMLNPSTADAEIDDPTIRSCIRLTKGMGKGGFEVVNLFAWRATNPDDLLRTRDPIGPLNDQNIIAAAQRCSAIICAWGAHQSAGIRGRRVLKLIRDTVAIQPHCLGCTMRGDPKHPLYIKSGTPLVPYPG